MKLGNHRQNKRNLIENIGFGMWIIFRITLPM